MKSKNVKSWVGEFWFEFVIKITEKVKKFIFGSDSCLHSGKWQSKKISKRL